MATAVKEADPPGATEQLCKPPSLASRLAYGSILYAATGFIAVTRWFQEQKAHFYPVKGGPDAVKSYRCRPHLPVRIFIPASYQPSASQTFPVLFSIVGGGWCIGYNREHDEWNRHFADSQNVLVIGLDHSKTTRTSFPGPVHDIEALILAALADESLPIDRTTDHISRVAVFGVASGAQLALSVCQLPSIRNHPLTPAAAISVAGPLDFTTSTQQKIRTRPYKAALKPSMRGDPKDALETLFPVLTWAYIPYGANLRDPLLSPGLADRTSLPPFVGLIAPELDLLAHEAWRLACRLAREGAGVDHGTPDHESKDPRWRVVGQDEVNAGSLLRGVGDGPKDDRFAFEEHWEGGGVKWILVPDALHGFDNRFYREMDSKGGPVAIKDAELKTAAYVDEIGTWLRERVWKL